MIGGRVPDRGWRRPFDEPIPLAGGRELVTLKDAASYSNSTANHSKLTPVPITGAFQTRGDYDEELGCYRCVCGP
jgi:hypothetical protein